MNYLLDFLIGLPPLASVLAKITLILLLAWGLHSATGRSNPRWRVLLWRGVMVAIPLLFLLNPISYLEITLAPPPQNLGSVQTSPPPVPQEPTAANEHSTDPTTEGSESAFVSYDPPSSAFAFIKNNPFSSLSLVWATIFLILAGRIVLGHIQIRKLIANSVEAPEDVRLILERVCRELGWTRRIGLRTSPQSASPFLVGSRNPAIVLPDRMLDTPQTADIPAVFAHEVAHLRSGDPFWVSLSRWMNAFLWFHPLVWRISSVHQLACEKTCDGVAAAYVEDETAYSAVLARVALAVHTPAPNAIGLPMARSSQVVNRLEALSRRLHSLRMRRHVVAVNGCLFLAAVLLLGGLRVARAQERVEGIVMDAEGAPVPHAEVVFLSQIYESGTNYFEGVEVLEETQADSEGKFFLNQLLAAEPNGQFIRATAPGYAYGYNMLNHPGRGRARFHDYSTHKGTDRLRITLPSGISINGRIVDEEGASISGARISVASIVDPVTSDATGHFSIEKINSRGSKLYFSPRLKVRHPDYLPRTHPNEYELVRDGLTISDTADIEITLEKGAIIEGRIFDKTTEEGLGHFAVHASSRSYPSGASAYADESGYYSLRVPEGMVRLNPFRTVGRGASSTNYYPVAPETTLQLEKGEKRNGIDFAFERGSLVSGIVKDAEGNPLSEVVYLTAKPSDAVGNEYRTFWNIRSAYSGSDGRYAIDGIRPGTYDILVQRVANGRIVRTLTSVQVNVERDEDMTDIEIAVFD